MTVARLCFLLLGVTSLMHASAAQPLLPVAEVEEPIYTYEPADNGAGPLWCYGSTCIARIGKDVFVSGLETLKDQKPLNNVRWLLYKRTDEGWKLILADPTGRTREPCPLVGFPDGRLFLSANPTLTAPGTYNGSAEPQVLEFSAASPSAPYRTIVQPWSEKAPFSEHSYRSFCGDGPNHELLALNNLNYDRVYWSFMDREGKWSAQGKLMFPIGVDYEKPEPIRLCYPEVALRNRAVHFMGVSDITEPVKAWREYKLQLNNGHTWDYDFRRLFYSWTPDITTTPFAQWVEIASREKTAGHITNLDMWLDNDGRAHLLWLETSMNDLRMREKFFPGVPLTHSLETCIVDKGQVVQRTTLASGGEGLSKLIPGFGRFQATPDGRLFVFYFCSGADEKGRGVAENRIMEIFPDGTPSDPVRVGLQHPFTSFMTATERGGSPPSNDLEIIGNADGVPGISYARISLLNKIVADFDWTAQRIAEGAKLILDASRTRCVAGEIASYKWDIGGAAAEGKRVEKTLPRGGALKVTLAAADDQGNSRAVTQTVNLPPAPTDFGLTRWGLVLRTEAESFVDEGGGEIHVRNDKLATSGLSLSHWNTKGHWLEWEMDIPQEDDYFLLFRYATPENAVRALTLDGKPLPTPRFPSSGGYGSEVANNWAFGALQGPDGKPLALRLTAGTHRLRLENPDGTGLNLDYMEWIKRGTQIVPGVVGRMFEEDGYHFALPLKGTLVPRRIAAEIGFCYNYPLDPRFPGDGVKDVPPSTMRLLENGKELTPAHAAHVDVRTKGKGNWSHWGTGLWFSTSDNSDPRTNGRKYTWEIKP